MGLGAGGTATGKFFNLYPHLCLEKVFPAVKLVQNSYLHCDTNKFQTLK